jgi:hypothetical protein
MTASPLMNLEVDTYWCRKPAALAVETDGNFGDDFCVSFSQLSFPSIQGADYICCANSTTTERSLKDRSVSQTVEGAHTYHSLYLAVHGAHAEAPHIWTVSHCTRILTSIMSAKPFAWRVVGVTEAALKKFHELNYRYQSRHGLTRAHLRPRIETVRELLARSEPMSQSEFIEYWFAHDRTVLCAVGENKTIVPQFIEIENSDGSLFSSNRIAWQHGKKERELLQTLYERSSWLSEAYRT